MPFHEQKLGQLGEDLACQYLEKRGYQILKRNFRTRGGEIDIVAWDRKEKVLVFVEVKTRTQGQKDIPSFGQAQEAVDFFKQKKLYQTALDYLSRNSKEQDFRIDVLALTLNKIKGQARVKHFQNVVEDSW